MQTPTPVRRREQEVLAANEASQVARQILGGIGHVLDGPHACHRPEPRTNSRTCAEIGDTRCEHAGAFTVDFRALPRVTFTRPQIASAGLTEEQARQEGYEVRVSTSSLFKLVADAKTDQLLGAHVLAESAGEVVLSAVYAIKFHFTIADLTETFHSYLTMTEGMKLAAQTFTRDVAKLSCCAV